MKNKKELKYVIYLKNLLNNFFSSLDKLIILLNLILQNYV